MKILSERDIRGLYNQDRALEMLRDGYCAYSAGEVQQPPAQQFLFSNVAGDCCIKSAWITGSSTFCVKVSTGFYQNPQRGLPSNDGLNMVFSAETGQPLALLSDGGWLTAMRTALAGRIVAELMLAKKIDRIAIFGTGQQAELQLRQLIDLTPCREVIVWGRSLATLTDFRQRIADLNLNLVTTLNRETCARSATVIVTATPAISPLIQSQWLQPGTHITAVGADSPGKQELDPSVLAVADCILVDSITQCRTYGELSHLSPKLSVGRHVLELGQLLMNKALYQRNENSITVADLTGLGVQDAQISASIVQQISL